MQTQGKFILMTIAEFQQYIQRQSVNRHITHIQNHHTWSPSYRNFNGSNHFQKLKGMEAYHKQVGFDQIAQNITTFPDGTIAICRSLNTKPAGIKYANEGGICIEHLGNFDRGKDQMTEIHKRAIIKVNACLCHKFELTPDTSRIVYHHWFKLSNGQRDGGGIRDHKTCPGTAFFGGNKEDDCKAHFLPLVRNELQLLRTAANENFTQRTGIVNAKILNVRSGPGTTFPIIQKLKEDARVTIYERNGSWDRIGDNHWVKADYIVFG
jgi:hypothetical protein